MGLATLTLCPLPARAAGLLASDGAVNDYFGHSVLLSGTMGLVGAVYNDHIGAFDYQGSAYLFRNLDTATGNVTQHAKLTASDGAAYDLFGSSVSLSGTMGLVGADRVDIGANTNQGSAYLFRNLDTATGNVTEHAKLTASDGAANDYFGNSVSLSGTMGLVGAVFDKIGSNTDQGSAYLFRNLDTATGNVTEHAKLIASDGAAYDYFGRSVSLSGNMGLVGADGDNIGSNIDQGSAYLFRNLDTATGNVTEHAKLTASDGADGDYFGNSVSLSGTMGLVGAVYDDIGANFSQGSAYLFRNLDTATGNVTQHAKLTASDGAAGDYFGRSVSLSGTMGLVGAWFDDIGSNSNQGSAYLFRNLDTATGNITQSVKLIASDGVEDDRFGGSVALDGDQFIIGAYWRDNHRGKAYSGHVRTFLTADLGNDATATDGISFISWDDWIVGQNTSNNTITLNSGDTGNVTQTGRSVFIGQNNSSNNNTLSIAPNALLISNNVTVGDGANQGNRLALNGQIDLTSGSSVIVRQNSILSGNGTINSGAGLSITGSLRPGNGGLGRLTVNGSSATWNSGTPWVFELGTASSNITTAFTSNTTQDWLLINGSFNKGTGSAFTFDFAGTGQQGWYKLVDWTGSTTFAATDFTGINLASGLFVGNFTIDSGTSALYVQVIPEPASWLLLAAGLTTLVIARRRRRSTS